LVKRLSLQEHVIFQAALTDAELCWLYRNCALLIAPSSIEGFGLPVAEGLHCGSRVLCSDIPIFREIGGARCSYFPLTVTDPSTALAHAIRSALREAAPEMPVANRFSPADIAQQHIALYSSLIAGKGPAPSVIDSVRYAGYAS
jgi:glycosyltransferase involved in cell wall biosynthesis